MLGFPFIFRGALDVRATAINKEMELAATHALADLAKQDVPDSVCRAYGVERLQFGTGYLIPKPFDPRVLLWVSPAVARAAMQTGVAQHSVNLDAYREELEERLGKAHEVSRMMVHKAQSKSKPKRVVFPEGENDKVLRAAQRLLEENIAVPILLGDSSVIHTRAAVLGLALGDLRITDPATAAVRKDYVDELFHLRQLCDPQSKTTEGRSGIPRSRTNQHYRGSLCRGNPC